MMQRRRMLMVGQKDYVIRLMGLSTVSHMPTSLLDPCTITDTGDLTETNNYRIWLKTNEADKAYHDFTEALRCTYQPAVPYTTMTNLYDTVGHRDYIEITKESVKLYRIIAKSTLPSSLHTSTSHNGTLHHTGYRISAIDYGVNGKYSTLSTHFRPIGDVNSYVPYDYPENGFWASDGRFYFIMRRADIGGTSTNTDAEVASMYASFIEAEIASGKPCFMYYPRNEATVTDLTNTAFGQACTSDLYYKRDTLQSNAIIEIKEVE